MPELAVIVPTLGRPQALRPLVESFAATTSDFRIVFVVDQADSGTRRVVKMLADYCPFPVRALVHDGNYVEKTNAGIEATDEPFVLPGADDIRPHPGWFDFAKAEMSDEIGFVSLNDLGNWDVMHGKYATLPLVARWYIDSLDDDLYHEGYHHNGVDVDASLTAQARGAFAYAPAAVMEHLHPDWGKNEVDETYERGAMNAEKRAADHELLEQRWPGWQETIANL